MEPAVFVADDYVVGPLRDGVDQEAEAGGVVGEIEFQLRGVGFGGLERGEERSASGGDGSVGAAGAVDEAHFAGRRSEGRVLGAVGGRGGFVEAGAEGDDEVAVGLGLGVEDGVGEVAVDLAEIFFLAVGEHGFMAGGGESEQESEVDDRAGRGGDGGDAGEFGLAGEPEDQGRSEGQEEAADGGEESEDGERGGEIHVAGEGGRHGGGSGKEARRRIVGVGIDFVGDPIVFENDGEERAQHKQGDAGAAAGRAGR